MSEPSERTLWVCQLLFANACAVSITLLTLDDDWRNANVKRVAGQMSRWQVAIMATARHSSRQKLTLASGSTSRPRIAIEHASYQLRDGHRGPRSGRNRVPTYPAPYIPRYVTARPQTEAEGDPSLGLRQARAGYKRAREASEQSLSGPSLFGIARHLMRRSLGDLLLIEDNNQHGSAIVQVNAGLDEVIQ